MSRVVFVFYQGSPLQYARLSALAASTDLCLVQVVEASSHYEWGDRSGEAGFRIEILFKAPPGNKAEEDEIFAALTRLDPDIVFVLGYGRRFSRAALSYALTKRKRAVLISDTTAQNARAGPVGRLIKSAIVGAFDSAFVAGRPQARYVQGLGVPSSSVFNGYDVVDNDEIIKAVDAARATFAAGVATPNFLCVARLIDEKNLPFLIDAFGDFARNRPQSRRILRIAGYGALRDELQAQIDASGLTERISLLGRVPYHEMPMLYASTDCLILPSGSETWGLVVNEAMAAGLAVVVSSSCGCVEDLVASGDNGFVFDPDDRAGLVAALERLDDDPDLAAKMGQRGREIIGDWSLGRFVEGAQAAANAAKTAPRFPLRRALARVFLALLRLRPDRARGFGG
jgi:glycosyltransferase involved in cell wall biosynthesis